LVVKARYYISFHGSYTVSYGGAAKGSSYRLTRRRLLPEIQMMEIVPPAGFATLFRSPAFLSALMSLLVAQFAKAVIGLFGGKPSSFHETLATMFWKTGGMPSSHSALVIALTTSFGFSRGTGSDIFVLSLFVSLIVIRDAMGVRRAAGLQARALNVLGERSARRLKFSFKPVKEIHGHTLPQVIVGSLMGFFIALAVHTL
jgi:acid phosphatase family membrane protein YuiD